MPIAARRRHTLDEYFAIEAISLVKHEYLDGEIHAMAGGSVAHNRVATNVLLQLGSGLGDGPCEPFGGDLRIRTTQGLYTYPDVTVVCGEPVLVPDRPDTVTNPALLVEVLSPSTRDYDRTEKLAAYQAISSVREILLIEQERAHVEHVVRTEEGWTRRIASSLDDDLDLAVGVTLSLRAIYRRVLGEEGRA